MYHDHLSCVHAELSIEFVSLGMCIPSVATFPYKWLKLLSEAISTSEAINHSDILYKYGVSQTSGEQQLWEYVLVFNK